MFLLSDMTHWVRAAALSAHQPPQETHLPEFLFRLQLKGEMLVDGSELKELFFVLLDNNKNDNHNFLIGFPEDPVGSTGLGRFAPHPTASFSS